MKSLSALTLAVAALGLAACINATPLALPDDHPANPTAPAGLVGAPSALEGYKTENDFLARAAADAEAPASSQMQHQGMQHGGMNMPGMQMQGMQHGGMAMPPGGGAR